MNLQQRITKSLNIPKHHKPKRAIKSLISNRFHLDGNLFIERFDILSNNTSSMEHRDFRAKAIVDLIMSIECSLKSICISLSKDNETPYESYKMVRKLSHNLDNLYNEAEKRAKNRFKLLHKHSIFDDLKKLGVSSRYSYEIWSIKYDSNDIDIFYDEDLISKTIDDIQWAKLLRNEAVALNNLSSICHNKYLYPHHILTGNRMKNYFKELNVFINKDNKA